MQKPEKLYDGETRESWRDDNRDPFDGATKAYVAAAETFDMNELAVTDSEVVLDEKTLGGLGRESARRVLRFLMELDFESAFWEADLLQHYVRRLRDLTR